VFGKKNKGAKKAKEDNANTLLDDIKKYAEWISTALSSSGYNADFSVESTKEIDRFISEQSGEGGLLAEDTGSRLFALGSYVGEVVIRNYGGEWIADDNDPEGEMNISVMVAGHIQMWPVVRVMKVFKEGPENAVYPYVVALKSYIT